MGDQRRLDFDGRNPLAAYLQHIVRATTIPVVPVGVLVILIAGVNPVAVNGIFGLLMLVPVVGGGAIAANEQVADLAPCNSVSAFIGNQRLVAGHQLARAARPDLSRAVTDEDMQYLCAADAIQDIDMEFLLPAAQDIGGQRLTS